MGPTPLVVGKEAIFCSFFQKSLLTPRDFEFFVVEIVDCTLIHHSVFFIVIHCTKYLQVPDVAYYWWGHHYSVQTPGMAEYGWGLR